MNKGATFAVNKFADLTAEEFKKYYLSSQSPVRCALVLFCGCSVLIVYL